MIFFAKRKR